MENETQVQEAPVENAQSETQEAKPKRTYVKRKEEFYDQTPEQLKERLASLSSEIKTLKKDLKANPVNGDDDRPCKLKEKEYERQRLYKRMNALGTPIRGKREKKQVEQPKVEENTNGAENTVQQAQ